MPCVSALEVTRGGLRVRLPPGPPSDSAPFLGVSRKTRIISVVYNASNNELVRTNTLVKNTIVVVDAAPFRQWYATHYGLDLGKKRKEAAQEGAAAGEGESTASKHVQKKREARAVNQKMDLLLEEQFTSGRLLACISSRPGQVGRADGYVLEGPELAFYKRKLEKKSK